MIERKEYKSKDYEKIMKEVGINSPFSKNYKSAEKYARSFQKTSVQKHAQVAFSTNTI